MPTVLAAEDAALSIRKRPADRNECAAGDAFHQLLHPGLVPRPLPATAPGFRREAAEAVSPGGFLGQAASDRDEDAPHDEQGDNDQ